MPRDKNIKYASRKGEPLFLITNDDGINSEGLKKLASVLRTVGDVLVMAPSVEQSATSHSLTLYRPLRCKKIATGVYAMDGTPADCVSLAVNFILKGRRPSILFSGINRGPNLGDDVHYSGTVSAAVEGGIMGIPSVSISVAGSRDPFKFDAAADFAKRVAKQVLKHGLPDGIILNINVPNLPKKKIAGYKITFQGRKNYSNTSTEKFDPRGEKYYWICGEEAGFDDIKGSDCNAISEGYVSITPIRVDLTEHRLLKKMKDWKF